MIRFLWLCPMIVVIVAQMLADQVHLKDGRVLKGKIVYEDEEKVVLKAKYGKVTILKENIEKIVRNDKEGWLTEEKKRSLSVEEIIRRYARGDDSMLEKLKGKEETVWVAKRVLRYEKDQTRKVRLEALIRELTRCEPEKMEKADEIYKSGLSREREWRMKYESLRKGGKSHREAVKATAKELAEAIALYKKALSLWKYHDDVRLHLGVLYYQARLLKEAIKTLSPLVVADEPTARRTVGAAQMLLGDYNAALKSLDKLEDPLALDLRIQCLLRTKNFSKALRLAKKLQAKDPKNPKGMGYEGMALLGLGRYKKAVEKLREAFNAGERSRPTVYSLAAALARTKSEGDLREAESLLRSLLKEDPAYVPAVIELTRILVKQERKSEARDIVKEALNAVRKGSREERLLKKILSGLGK